MTPTTAPTLPAELRLDCYDSDIARLTALREDMLTSEAQCSELTSAWWNREYEVLPTLTHELTGETVIAFHSATEHNQFLRAWALHTSLHTAADEETDCSDELYAAAALLAQLHNHGDLAVDLTRYGIDELAVSVELIAQEFRIGFGCTPLGAQLTALLALLRGAQCPLVALQRFPR